MQFRKIFEGVDFQGFRDCEHLFRLDQSVDYLKTSPFDAAVRESAG